MLGGSIQTKSKLDYRILFNNFEKTKNCTFARMLELTNLSNTILGEPNTSKPGFLNCVEKTIQWYEDNRNSMMKERDYGSLAQLGAIADFAGRYKQADEVYKYLMESKLILDDMKCISDGMRIIIFVCDTRGAKGRDPKLALKFFKKRSGFLYAVCLGQVAKMLHKKKMKHNEAIELLKAAEKELEKPMPFFGENEVGMKSMQRFNNGQILGDAYWSIGHIAGAVETYEQALEDGKCLDEHWQNLLTKFDLLHHLGQGYQSMGNTKKAKSAFQELLDMPKRSDQAKQIIKIEPEYKKKYKDVLNLFKESDFQVEEKEKEEEDPIKKTMEYLAHLRIHWAKNAIEVEKKPMEGLGYIIEGVHRLGHLDRELTPMELLTVANLRGQAYSDLGQYIEAALGYNAILDGFTKKRGLIINQYVILFKQGRAFCQAGYYSEAKSALKIVASKTIPDAYRTVECYYYIGVSYFALQRYSHAIEYIQKGILALGKCLKQYLVLNLWDFELLLANCYFKKNEVTQARKILSKLQNTKDTETKMKALELDGHCLMSLKRYRKGLELLAVARNYYQRQNTALQITLSIAKYAKKFEDVEKYNQAISDALKSNEWKNVMKCNRATEEIWSPNEWMNVMKWKNPDSEAMKLYGENLKSKNMIFSNSLLICVAFKYRKY